MNYVACDYTKLMTYSIFKSRTFWTGIVMYLITNGPVISSAVPAQWKALIDAVLTLLMFYFHTNPSQNYNITE